MPVLQAIRERPLRLASGKGRQDQRDACAIINVVGRHRLAHATKDVATITGRIGQYLLGIRRFRDSRYSPHQVYERMSNSPDIIPSEPAALRAFTVGLLAELKNRDLLIEKLRH